MHMQPVHVITSAAFHPSHGDLLAYSTSKTVLSVMDLRQKDICGDQAITFQQPVQVCAFHARSFHKQQYRCCRLLDIQELPASMYRHPCISICVQRHILLSNVTLVLRDPATGSSLQSPAAGMLTQYR